MAVKPNDPPAEPEVAAVAAAEPVAEATPLAPGFHVMHDGTSLGCYPTEADAEAFADSHPRANGLTVTVEEVAG